MEYSTQKGLQELADYLEIGGERFPIKLLEVNTVYNTSKPYIDALVRYTINRHVTLGMLETIVTQLAFSVKNGCLLEKYGTVYRTEIQSNYTEIEQSVYLELEAIGDTLHFELVFAGNSDA